MELYTLSCGHTFALKSPPAADYFCWACQERPANFRCVSLVARTSKKDGSVLYRGSNRKNTRKSQYQRLCESLASGVSSLSKSSEASVA